MIKKLSVHLLLWSIFIVSEYLANAVHLRPGAGWTFMRSTLLSLPLLMAPTYFLALFAVPRLLQQNKKVLFMIVAALVAFTVFWARIKWTELINYLEMNRYYSIPASKVVKNVIRDYAVIALAVCLSIISDWRQKQLLNEQLIKNKAEAEIKLLKGQLHPHFLFNSLNNIYSLALIKSDLTADSILKLTELLDYLIYEAGKDKVALAKEIQLLHNYIELEKLRYENTLQIQVEIEIFNESISVTPLILLPFAENCFKHGGPGRDGIFHIIVELRVQHNQLSFYLKNTKKRNAVAKTVSGGIGLQNIQQRLQLVYPNRHLLTINDLEDYYEVKLEINFT